MINPPESYVLDEFRFLDSYIVESGYPDYSVVWVDVSSLDSALSLEYDDVLKVIIESSEIDKSVSYQSTDNSSRILYTEISRPVEYDYSLNSRITQVYLDNTYRKDCLCELDSFVYEDLDVVYAYSAVIERENVIIDKPFVFDVVITNPIIDEETVIGDSYDSISYGRVIDDSLNIEEEYGLTSESLILNENPTLDRFNFNVFKVLDAFLCLPPINEEMFVNIDFSLIKVDFSTLEPSVYFEFIVMLNSQIIYESEPPRVITCEEHCKEIGGSGSCNVVLEIPVEVGSYNLIVKIGKDIRKMTGLPMQHFWDTNKKAVAGFVTFVEEKILEVETVDGELLKFKLIPYNSWEKPSLDKIIR